MSGERDDQNANLSPAGTPRGEADAAPTSEAGASTLNAMLAELGARGGVFGPPMAMASAAERMRRSRARAAGGLAVLPVETNVDALAEYLVATGRLREWDAADRAVIAEATGRMLDEIVAAGVQEPEI